jgi:NADH dehydrogenase
VHLGASVVEVLPDRVRTEAGEWVPAESTFWTAGIQPSPLLRQIEGLPLTDRGYIKTQADLRVEGYDNVWAVGDAASVPMPNGKPFAATAQNAVRQGPQVAKNILSSVGGKPLENFEYRSLGAFAVVGGYKAAADLFGFNVNGLIGWFMFRGAYLSKMPTFALKLRLSMDWFLDLFLRVPTVQIGVHRSRIPMPPGAKESNDVGSPN